MNTKQFKIEKGDWLKVDGWAWGAALADGLDHVDDGFAGSQFTLPSAKYEHINYPVNIEITGRNFHYIDTDHFKIRVRVTFIGDCEPDTTAGGWLTVESRNAVWQQMQAMYSEPMKN